MQRTFQKWDVGEVLWPGTSALAGQDPFQGQDGDLMPSPAEAFGCAIFGVKAPQPGYGVDEVDGHFTAEGHHRVGDDFAAEPACEIQDTHVLPWPQVHPEIDVKRDGRHSLQDRAHHSDDNKPYLLCAERVDK